MSNHVVHRNRVLWLALALVVVVGGSLTVLALGGQRATPSEGAEAEVLIDRLEALGYRVEPLAEPGAGVVAAADEPAAPGAVLPAPVAEVPRPATAEPRRAAVERRPEPAAEPARYEPVRETSPAAPASRPDPAPVTRPAESAPTPIEPAYDRPIEPAYERPAPAPRRPEPLTVTVPTGTELGVRLEAPLSSRTATPGQGFDLTLERDLWRGDLLALPAGTRLTGRVVEVERARRPQKPGKLVLELDALHVGGDWVGIDALLSADGGEIKGRGSHQEDAKRIGIGAVAGTVLGAVLEGKKGAVAGAILGGGGVFLATRGEDVELAQGTGLLATLDRDLRLELLRP